MRNNHIQFDESYPQPIEKIVQNENGQAFTTSLIVAEMFEKNHFDVLKAISNMECSQKFNDSNFTAVEYKDNKGEMRPAYKMTRDGFSFLAMGFTGKKAAAWKEKFLEAFNAMERALLLYPVNREMPKETPERSLQESWLKMLRGFASYWAYVDKIPLSVVEMILCRKMNVMRLEQILDETMDWNLPPNALAYAMDMCNRPTGNLKGEKASKEELDLLKNILTACGEWRFTRNINFEEQFENLTGIRPDQITDLSAHDARKMLATAGCLLHQTYQYSKDFLNFKGDDE